MSSFLKTIALPLGLWALWACPIEEVCKQDATCPEGSFCLKTHTEGVCTWGELAENGAVLPAVDVSFNPGVFSIETDSLNPKLKRVTSFLTLASDIPSSEIQLRIRAYGATSIVEPTGSTGVLTYCFSQIHAGFYVERTCILIALEENRFSIHATAQNNNGQSTMAIEWNVVSPPEGLFSLSQTPIF